jgi:hypothetical protein
MAGVRCVGEAGPPRLLPAFDAPRPRVRDSGECPLLLSSYIRWLLVLTIGVFPPFFRRWGGTSLPCHGSRRTRWTEPRGGSPRRRRRRRRTRRRPGPASGGGLETPWKSSVAGRRGRGPRGSHRRKRPTTMTMTKMMTRRTTWPPALPQPRLGVWPGAVKPAPERADAVSPRSRDVGVPARGAGATREGT